LQSQRNLSSAPRRLSKLPDMQRTTQLWQSVGWSFGPALFGQARELKQNALYLALSTPGLVITEDFLSNTDSRSDWTHN